MKIYGVRSSLKQLRILAGTISQLKNWKELRQNARKERRGENLTEPPILQFRNGLRIEMVKGGYSNFDYLLREIFLEKCYQPTPDFVPRRGWTVVDLGANMGFFTCQASFASPEVKVISVEPLPPYVEVLRKNIAQNRFAHVQVVPGAICGAPQGPIPLVIWYTASGELKTGAVQPSAARVETIQANAIPLSQVFELGQVERCDLLKVDIEGAEFELFENVSSALWSKIDRVVMEAHKDGGRSEKELVRILEKNGFEVHVSDETTNNPMLWAAKKNS